MVSYTSTCPLTILAKTAKALFRCCKIINCLMMLSDRKFKLVTFCLCLAWFPSLVLYSFAFCLSLSLPPFVLAQTIPATGSYRISPMLIEQ